MAVAVVFTALAGAGEPLRGQVDTGPQPTACAQGQITDVFVDNHSIWDADQLEGLGFFGNVYRLANALHVKTREDFIRRELLFTEGDCFDPLLIEESGRILRAYGFLARADVFAVERPDGSKQVVVDTQDEWTTKVNVGVSFDDGIDIESLSLTEENLAGEGVLGSVFLRQRKERRDVGGQLQLPRLLGSRTDVGLSAGRTRVGSFAEESVAYPFVGEVGRFAFRQSFARRDDLFPYATAGELGEYSHLLLPLRDERLEASVAGRLGRPGNLTLLGMGVSREKVGYPAFPGGLEVARESNFGNAEPAPDGSGDALTDQVHARSATRVNVFIGQRNLRFRRASGLDNLNGIQDIQLGTEVGLTLGRSVDVLSGGGDDANDLFSRLQLFAGHAAGSSYLFLKGAIEGRQVLSGPEEVQGWRDILGEVDLLAYLRSRGMPGHTFVARISGAGGWSMTVPFQLTLGGREALRGLRDEDFPGARRLLATLEDRIFLRWPVPDVIDLGLTVFAESGRVWAGQVPFGMNSRWKGPVGVGLRVGFPEGTRGVARFDVAVPVGLENTRSPIFRVTLHEPLGLLYGFVHPQVVRSRRNDIGPVRFTADPRR